MCFHNQRELKALLPQSSQHLITALDIFNTAMDNPVHPHLHVLAASHPSSQNFPLPPAISESWVKPSHISAPLVLLHEACFGLKSHLYPSKTL